MRKARSGSRITGGFLKGWPITTPPAVRATQAKVRLALFNILAQVIAGARVVDGFAGSGSLGLEALSRGAAFVAFIDSDTDAVLSIRDNLSRMESEVPRSAWRLLHMDVERGIRQLAEIEAPFDLVLLDPPYGADEGKKALNAVVDCAILARTGFLIIEHEHRATVPSAAGPLQQVKQHRYGDTVLSFYRAQ
jgi:16S rRNA (guanine(966)-N(2))-methyltransferase RsmD